MKRLTILFLGLFLAACATLNTPAKQLAAVYAGLTWADKQVATLVSTKDANGKRALSVDNAQLAHNCIVQAGKYADLAEAHFKQAKASPDPSVQRTATDQALKFLNLANQVLSGLRIALTAANPDGSLTTDLCGG